MALFRKNKKAICIIRNKKSGWVTAYYDSKKLYKDFMNRDLSRDYINCFEGWYNREFLEQCWYDHNKNFGLIYPESNESESDIFKKLKEYGRNLWGLTHYGKFNIDSKRKIVVIHELDGDLWERVN